MLPDFRAAVEVCRQVLAMQDGRGYHIGARYRADSFRLTAGQPMTIRRALALNAVLDACELPFIPGELLLGSGLGRLAREGDQAALEEAQACLREIGSRHFGTTSDHAAPDYPTVLAIGIGGLKARVAEAVPTHDDRQRETFLHSVDLALDGASRHFRRWADAADARADTEPAWSELLHAQAAMLRRLASEPASTFWEAVQLVYLLHAIFQLDERYAMALGRLDQFLYPYYRDDLAAGRVTETEAQAILDHLFAKLAHRGDIQNIALGGVDCDGNDATNALSYMCLEAVKRIGQPGGNVTARVHARTPTAFLCKCAEVIRTGIGFPAMFNDEIEIPGLVARGVPLEDARDYCFVGCIEVNIPGKQAPWSDSRDNLLHRVNLALWDGYDTVAEKQVGPHTGEPASWDEFFAAFLAQMRACLQAHIVALQAIKWEADARKDELTSPLLSAFFDDCISHGLDVAAGGTRYPANHGVAGMGIGTVADSLMAIKRFVYDTGRFTLADLRKMLSQNFEGYEAERHLLLTGAPKYGNDDPDVDAIAVEVTRVFAQECLKYATPYGGYFVGLMGANIQNISGGKEVGATPDGRLAFQPLSDAASPTFGRDKHGPTAAIRSIAKLPYIDLPAGNVINMKFHPSALAGDEGLLALAALIRTCFDLGGIQMQFNTTDRDLLKRAMAQPEDYRDLVVRVSGFSAYFTMMGRDVQEDILARTEHAFA